MLTTSNIFYGMLAFPLISTTGLGATLPGGTYCKLTVYEYEIADMYKSFVADTHLLNQKTLVQGIKTNVPSDFALSFDITPMGTTIEYGNIIHFTQDGTSSGPRGSIPGRVL